MLWRGRRGSGNISDRRMGPVAVGGGILGVIVFLLNYFLGGDGNVPEQIQQPEQRTEQQIAADDTLAQFVSVVLAETEDVWNKIFADNGSDYPEPRLVLFREATQSGCGFASAATGPFYCPADQQVYIDLSFYEDLGKRFGASGDFAMAYVIAHEVGHHVQHIMGTTDKLAQLKQQVSEKEYNRYSVMLELQADFFAGVWANHIKEKGILEEGDIEEALNAANAIGDDRLQQQSQGYVVPDAFTHGTSEQRMYWFRKGFKTGDVRQGNTFEGI